MYIVCRSKNPQIYYAWFLAKPRLCYNYDEKYEPNDRFPIQKLYLLNANVLGDSVVEDYEVIVNEVMNEYDNHHEITPRNYFNAISYFLLHKL